MTTIEERRETKYRSTIKIFDDKSPHVFIEIVQYPDSISFPDYRTMIQLPGNPVTPRETETLLKLMVQALKIVKEQKEPRA